MFSPHSAEGEPKTQTTEYQDITHHTSNIHLFFEIFREFIILAETIMNLTMKERIYTTPDVLIVELQAEQPILTASDGWGIDELESNDCGDFGW